MSNGESVSWVGVDFGILSSFLVEDFLSEHVFFLGSEGDTILSNVLEEISVGINTLFAEIFESKGESGFAE